MSRYSSGPPSLKTARDLVTFTETWWGEELDDALAKRIGKAPYEHVSAFAYDWPLSITGNPELTSFTLSPRSEGGLRPAWRGNTLAGGLAMLLHCDRAVLSSGYLGPLSPLEYGPVIGLSKKSTVKQVGYGFRNLAVLKPFIVSGDVEFMNLRKPNYVPMHWAASPEVDYRLFENEVREEHPHLSAAEIAQAVDVRMAGLDLSQIWHLASAAEVTPIATTVAEEAAIANWATITVDSRASTLAGLGRFATPRLDAKTKELRLLRQDSAAFRKWRATLSGAMSATAGLPDTTEGVREARARIVRELGVAEQQVADEVRMSPALSALHQGAMGFAIGFVTEGAAAAAAGYPPEEVLLAAAGAGTVGAVIQNLAEMGPRTMGRITDSLAMTFRPLD